MSDHDRTITLDFETRSMADLPKVGAWRYAGDPTTEALCLAYTFGLDEEVHLWHMATDGIEESPPPEALFQRIREGWLLEAHNAMFERAIWHCVMRDRHDWPEVGRRQWRCSAAKAAYHCLPRALDDAARILELRHQKDPVGKELIKALSKPRKILKREWNAHLKACARAEEEFERPPQAPNPWNEDQDLIRRNWEYCKQDVRTERALSLDLPDVPERELRVWQMDQEMNARGVAVDLEMAEAAIEMAKAEVDDLNRRLSEIVPGAEKATQRARVKEWLQHPDRIPYLPDTSKETVAALLKRRLPGDVMQGSKVLRPGPSREVLTIMRKVNKSSLAKYQSMLNVAGDDSRLRDLMMYAGAHTLRWVGKNVQPHNFPRGGIKHIETAADVIKSRDREWARFLYGDVMELLSHALRGALVSGRGKRLWVADFSAIEARVIFWLSDCMAALDVFARGDDIYCDMSGRIYGRTITKDDATERQLGKQSILGLGFGMGFCKFLMTLRKYGIKFTKDQVREIVGDEDCRRIMKWLRNPTKYGGLQYVKRAGMREADMPELVLTKFIVDLYRSDYPEVPAFWKAQEAAAIRAVEERTVVEAGKITWELDGRRLLAHLPSGTAQTYWDPQVGMEREELDDYEYQQELRAFKPKRAKKGDFDELVEFEEYLAKKLKRRKKLEYHGLDQKTKQWTTHGTYGGEIAENVTQHFARDLMAEAMLRIEESPTYDNLLSVHDEEIAESLADEGSKDEFYELISRCPPWAAGCPVDAEVADIKFRYKKG